jgi:chromosome segregation ATPase
MKPGASASVEQNQLFRQLKEKVEILNGDRGDQRKAAMRQGDAQDLREFIANLRKGTADVQKDLADAVDKLNQLGTTLDQVEQSLDDTKADLEQTEQALVAAQATLSTLQQTLTSVQSSIEQAQQSIEALDQSSAAVASELAALRAAATGVTVPDVSAVAVSAPPTAAEYNALLGDLIAMRTALLSLKAAIDT